MLGTFYVTVIILATPRIEATATLALVIAGQLSASTLMDHSGVLGLPKHPADWVRLLGVGFLILGAWLIRR